MATLIYTTIAFLLTSYGCLYFLKSRARLVILDIKFPIWTVHRFPCPVPPSFYRKGHLRKRFLCIFTPSPGSWARIRPVPAWCVRVQPGSLTDPRLTV